VIVGLGILLAPSLGVVGPRVDADPSGPLATPVSPLSQALASLAQGSGPALGHALDCRGSQSVGYSCRIGSAAHDSPATPPPQWTNLTGSIAPPRSDSISMTYDATDNYVLLFGGQSSTGWALNDTWTFSGGQWRNITATAGAAPTPPRYDMAMTYDAVDHYVLAFGGFTTTSCPFSGPGCNDTWSFAGGKWRAISASPPTPNVGAPYDLSFSMVYDVTDSYVVATNGFDTWKYSGGVWSRFCGTNCTNFIPGPQLIGSVADDAANGYVLFLGGQPCNGCGATQISGSFTWKFASGLWTNITATVGTPPPSRLDPAMSYDTSTGGVVLFGGEADAGSGGFRFLSDTWSFVGGSWTNITSVPSPPGRFASGMADDSTDSGIVLFGGGSDTVLNDTWIWGANPPIGELVPSVRPSVPIPGSAASFNVSFVGGTSPFTYSWRFGDGNSSILRAPTHAFGKEGYYVVQVWVNDSAGHSATASFQVHVYVPLAVAILQATPNPAVLGQPVSFTADATGGTPPYSYSWVFGDGGVGGNLSSITHVYTTNGPFQAEVTVSDAIGGMARAYVNISIKLQALAGSSTSTGTYPLTVSFVGQAQGGTPPYDYLWNFGDGTTSNLQDPHHTYNSSGQFDVVLTVEDSKDNRSSSSLSIQVGGPSAGGPAGSEWFVAFVIALVVAASLATAWGVTILGQHTRRREGERWIEELTSEEAREANRITKPK
jgi:PKD repeat protein